jgi:5-methylcytosine-specific restriction endonuclease McrA
MSRAHNFKRKDRAKIALRANGRCEKCGAKLKVGEGDADHILPVELGGESVIENGQWLCTPCHKSKTADDIRRMRKAERQRDRHIGAKAPSRNPLPGSKASGWKKKMNGEWVRR